MFDCLVSNPDRHHENWGIVSDILNKKRHLAPTFDHASGLGCRVSDRERGERLVTEDRGYTVDAFVRKARSAFYDKNSKLLKTDEAFMIATKLRKEAAVFWLDQVEKVSDSQVRQLFEKVPKKLISEVAIEFGVKVFESNRNRLLDIRKDLLQ